MYVCIYVCIVHVTQHLEAGILQTALCAEGWWLVVGGLACEDGDDITPVPVIFSRHSAPFVPHCHHSVTRLPPHKSRVCNTPHIFLDHYLINFIY